MPQADISKVNRHPERANYNKRELLDVLDSSHVCQVAFQVEGQPFVIPMMYYSDREYVYIHGNPSARILKHLRDGKPLAVSFLEINGFVIAKRLANDSMNYRSAIVFGRAQEVVENDSKLEIFVKWIDKMMPGRTSETILPSEKELKGVSVFKIKIENFSVKTREGGPSDNDEKSDIWSGTVPISQLLSDPKFESSSTPSYVWEFIKKENLRNSA